VTSPATSRAQPNPGDPRPKRSDDLKDDRSWRTDRVRGTAHADAHAGHGSDSHPRV
jgi:hypothetical protein